MRSGVARHTHEGVSDVTASTLRATMARVPRLVLTATMSVCVLLAACSGPQRVAAPRRAASTPTSTTSAIAPTTTVTPDVCATEPVRATPDPNRPRYRLRVDVRPDERTVQGDLAVVFTPDVATDRLVFRLWPNGPRLSRAGAQLDTDAVTVDGAAVTAERETPTMLVVGRGTTFAAGRAVEVRLTWTLRLPGSLDDRISLSGDAVRLGSFFPILGWEPGVGWATARPRSTRSPPPHRLPTSTSP